MYSVTYIDRGQKYSSEFIGDEREIRERLSREGKVVLSLRQNSVFLRRKIAVKSEEVYAVLSAMGDMLSSGVSLTQTINTIILSLDKKSGMRPVLLTILTALNQGKELSVAMGEFNEVFGLTTISMVRAGENSGKLAESLLTSAKYLITINAVKKEMFKKMASPVAIFVVGIFALLFNTKWTIPKIMSSELFQIAAKSEDTPFFGILNTLSIALPIVIALFVAVGFFMVVLYKTHQESVEQVLLKIPILREFIFYRGFYITFFAMSKLMEVGVNEQTSLEIVKGSTNVIAIKHDIESAIKRLRQGDHFAHGFKHISAIEKTMLETSHNRDKICFNLMHVAERFYEQYISRVRSFAPRVYLFTIVFVGGVFILMVLGIMVPYTKMLGGIK